MQPAKRTGLSSVAAALVTLSVATAAAAAVHGYLSDRWSGRDRLLHAGQLLEQLPSQIGPWRLQQGHTIAQPDLDMLRCTGYVHRVYVHGTTGETVRLAILVGPSGPIAAHTPDICYASDNYEESAAATRIRLSAADAPVSEFRALTLRHRSDALGSTLRVCYGWSSGGAWSAPDHPRWEFMGRPLLFKLQLASDAADAPSQDPCRRFLDALLPVMDSTVFGSLVD
jgi:hypothetical protein